MLSALLLGLLLTVQDAGVARGAVETLPGVEVSAPAIEGSVTLECGFMRDGRLRDCVVLSEQPAGYGFGEAAMQSAGESRLSRRVIEEAAPDGKVRFTARFRLPDRRP